MRLCRVITLTATVWPSLFTQVSLDEMFSVTGVWYIARSHLICLIFAYFCVKMECLTVKSMKNFLCFNTRICVSDVFHASVRLKIKHNASKNVWCFVGNVQLLKHTHGFNFTSLKPQRRSLWAGQRLCASPRMLKRRVPWRKTLAHKTHPILRSV